MHIWGRMGQGGIEDRGDSQPEPQSPPPSPVRARGRVSAPFEEWLAAIAKTGPEGCGDEEAAARGPLPERPRGSVAAAVVPCDPRMS